MMMAADSALNQCFLTVGTTSFDSLLRYVEEHADQVLEQLERRNVRRFVIQYGRGAVKPKHIVDRAAQYGVSVVSFEFSKDVPTYIQQSELVISHAGAGSILEALRAHRGLLVVINEELMDNHQLELAEALANLHHLRWCYVRDFVRTLTSFDQSELVPYPDPDYDVFPRLLDEAMGLADPAEPEPETETKTESEPDGSLVVTIGCVTAMVAVVATMAVAAEKWLTPLLLVFFAIAGVLVSLGRIEWDSRRNSANCGETTPGSGPGPGPGPGPGDSSSSSSTRMENKKKRIRTQRDTGGGSGEKKIG